MFYTVQRSSLPSPPIPICEAIMLWVKPDRLSANPKFEDVFMGTALDFTYVMYSYKGRPLDIFVAQL